LDSFDYAEYNLGADEGSNDYFPGQWMTSNSSATPEPSTVVMMPGALLALALAARKRSVKGSVSFVQRIC
jgi:hypothetical protein